MSLVPVLIRLARRIERDEETLFRRQQDAEYQETGPID
jgi:hypothetical protein